MTSSTKPTPVAAPEPAVALAVALVLGAGAAYPLFDTACATAGGIFLAGPYFLEVDEEATLEFHLSDGAVRARARVIEVRRGEQPGMVVALVDTDEATSTRITTAAAAAG